MPLPMPLRSSSSNNSHANPSAYYRREHQTETKRFEKEGRVWYSHRQGNAWCKEK
jgi:hypothetical protein